MKLNLGCGLELREGYINIDCRRELSGIIYGDVTCLNMIPDRSCEEIFASHLLEHLPDTIDVLNHWRSKLTPNGTLIVKVPDLEGCMEWFLKASHFERYSIPGYIRTIYGDPWHSYNGHLTGFTEERLKQVLGDAHFRSVLITHGIEKGAPELEARACLTRPLR